MIKRTFSFDVFASLLPILVSLRRFLSAKPALHSSALTRLKICRVTPDGLVAMSVVGWALSILIKACHRRASDLCRELKS